MFREQGWRDSFQSMPLNYSASELKLSQSLWAVKAHRDVSKAGVSAPPRRFQSSWAVKAHCDGNEQAEDDEEDNVSILMGGQGPLRQGAASCDRAHREVSILMGGQGPLRR